MKSIRKSLTAIGLLGITLVATAEFTVKTVQNTPIYAQIADEYRKVGELSANQRFSAQQPTAEQQVQPGQIIVSFGNEWGEISGKEIEGQNQPFEPEREKTDNNIGKSAMEKTTDLTDYILTQKPTALYAEADLRSTKIARLEADLRYPIIEKLSDKQQNLWYRVTIADRPAYIYGKDVQPDNGIPIVMYHHVLQNFENKKFRNTPTTVSTEALDFQFDTIKSLGFKSIRLDSVERYLQGKINLPAKAFVLTFDDGLKSVYRYAYPLLKRYGFNATFFVITSRIQQKPQLWAPDELQFLSVSEYQTMADVANLQSHTHALHHYVNFKAAATQSNYQTLYVDLVRSQQELAKLNSPTKYLAYPFGVYTDEFINAAKNSGFTLALTTKWGKVKFGDDPMLLKRVYFTSETDKAKIIDTLSNQ